MNIMIAFDSQFGNTEKVARAIAEGLDSAGEVVVRLVSSVQPGDIQGLDLLVVGSPTQRFRPTEATSKFLKSIHRGGLVDVGVASFDTRFTQEEIDKIKMLSFFVGIFGYAAKPIADGLVKKGGKLLLPPEGFYVDGIEGPLLPGKLERARTWGESLIQLMTG